MEASYDSTDMDCHNVQCNSCDISNFRGRRYKCLRCDSFNLCQSCYDEDRCKEHKSKHPMQCILTRSDFELYYGGEDIPFTQPVQSYTCPYCGKTGFSLQSFNAHVETHSLADRSTPVQCVSCNKPHILANPHIPDPVEDVQQVFVTIESDPDLYIETEEASYSPVEMVEDVPPVTQMPEFVLPKVLNEESDCSIDEESSLFALDLLFSTCAESENKALANMKENDS